MKSSGLKLIIVINKHDYPAVMSIWARRYPSGGHSDDEKEMAIKKLDQNVRQRERARIRENKTARREYVNRHM